MKGAPREQLSRAELLLTNGNYRDALSIVQTLAVSEGLPVDDRLACLLLESRLRLKLGEFDKALALIPGLTQGAREQEDPLLLVDVLIVQTEASWRLGKLDEGLAAVEEAETLLAREEAEHAVGEQRENKQRRARLLHHWGVILWYKGDFDQALTCHQRSLELKEELGNSRGIAASLNNLGLVHWSKGDLDEALEYYRASLAIHEEMGNEQEMATVFNNLGGVYRFRGELDSALEYLGRSLAIREELGSKKDIASSLSNVGAIYHLKGDLDRALDYYQRSLAVSDELGVRQDIALALGNLGDAYQLKGELDRALEYHQRSLAIYEELGIKRDVARVLTSIGETYRKRGNAGRALEYYQRSLAMCEEIGNDPLTATALCELVCAAIETNEPTLVEQYLQELQQINERTDNPIVSQRYRVARALSLKTSKRARHRVEAGEILEQVVDEEVADHSLTVTAMIHLCDLLLSELKMTGEEEILGRVKDLTRRLIDIAKLQASHSLLAEAYLLQSKLALMELDVQRARGLLSQAHTIAEERGLHTLARAVARERDMLLSQLQKWELIIQQNPSRQEMIDLTRLDEFLERMIQKTVATLSREEEAPSEEGELLHPHLLPDSLRIERSISRAGTAQIGMSEGGDIPGELYEEKAAGRDLGSAATTQLRLLLFGQPRLERAGEAIELGLRKATALLAYLATTEGMYSRDDLAALLWPESSPSSARASLRRTLYRINKAVGEQLLPTGTDTIYLNPEITPWTDVKAFRQLIEECAPEGAPVAEGDPHCLATLEAAIALYRGDLLAGFSLPDCPSFDEWCFFESENLRGSLASALKQLVSAYESQGEFDQAIQYARQWLSLDSLHEPAHRLLMGLYAKSGQQAAALRQYGECVRILDQELGLAPQPETTELYESIRLRRQAAAPLSAKVIPDVRYVSSGDVHIAYQVLGEGPVDVLFVCGFLSHLEAGWDEPSLGRFFYQLASVSRLILFDRRGVGLSDRVGYAPTLENTVDDMLAVMQAAGSERAVLFGYLEGGPNSMLFAATYPERVAGLVLYGTCAKWTRSEDYPWALTEEQYDRWLEYITENWGEALNIETYAPSVAQEARFREWWARMLRLASSPGGLKAVLEVMREIDVREILPAISVPTLVLQRKGDRAIRVGAGRHLAGQIPGAKYIELEGQDHWPFVGDTQSIVREIQAFVQNLGSPAAPQRMLATILLVEPTAEDGTHGKGSPVQIEPDPVRALLREKVARFRGSEIGWSQGRYTAIFDGPSRAIHCANAIIEAARRQEINLRAGLHTGECAFTAGGLGGAAVRIAEGVLKSAAPNEVLASRTVRDLVAGSGFHFADRGRCAIEGVSGEWAMFCVG